MPTLDVLSQLLFSQTSPLFQKLYIEEQVVDLLSGGAVDHRDAPLFTIIARNHGPRHGSTTCVTPSSRRSTG